MNVIVEEALCKWGMSGARYKLVAYPRKRSLRSFGRTGPLRAAIAPKRLPE